MKVGNIDSFRKIIEQQTIMTAGQISDAGKVEINYSSPLTKLIQ